MRKYRVKNEDGRILGPFNITQIKELHQKDQILETSMFQVFPIGDWEKSSDIKEIKTIFKAKPEALKKEKQNSSSQLNDEVPPPVQAQVEPNIARPEIDTDSTAFREFKFNRQSNDEVDYSEIKKAYQAKVEEEEVEKELDDSVDKTVVVNRKSLNAPIEKTVVVSRDDLAELEEGAEILAGEEPEESNEEANEEANKNDKKEEEQQAPPEEKVDFDERTIVANLKDIQAPVVTNIEDDIAEIESKIRSFELEGSVEQKRKSKKKQAKKQKETEEKKDNKKRNLSFALFLVAVIFFLMPEDEEKLTKVVRPNVIFPQVLQKRNLNLATEKRKEGLKELVKGDYLSTLKAIGHFQTSLQNKFKDNQALSLLIYSYAKLLPEIGNDIKATRTLYRLINIQRPKILSDPYMALGAAKFYAHNGKHDTAVYVLENHLRINKPTPLLYAEYLYELLIVGNFIQAEKIFNQLENAPDRSYEVLRALTSYHVTNERIDNAINLLKANYKKNIKNNKFLALYGNLLLKSGDYKTLAKITKFLLDSKGGGSPFVYAEGLKFLGYIAISKGQSENVAKYFNESLKYYDSYELKRILASLDVGGTDLTQQIIKRSKIDVLIKKSKKEAKNLNWEKAFQYAVRASDLDETSLESQLYLASIQSKRGYLNAAISTLDKLRDKYPTNVQVSYELVMANIRAFKKAEARRLISLMSTNLKFKDSYEYLAIFGHYYKLIENDKLAYERFKGALQKNPLRDDIYFEMAKIALKNNKLKRCKQFLNDAQQLDPRNIDYKVMYSKVLFEENGLETAIGYLRSQLENFRDHPKLLGQMAVFYYRDQSIKEYKEYKERLERLSKKDESLYRFLVNSAELEKNYKSLIKSAESLVLVAPGDLESRMKLANAYTIEGQYQKAIDQLNEVEQRLESYPNVNYYKAKIYLVNRDYKKAEIAGNKEVKINPESEYGYYILGEIYLKMAKYNLAKKNLEKSIQLRPDFYECLLALGWLKFKQGYYAAARELYQRALRKRPNDPEIHKRLGYVYKETGQGDMAVEEFRTYLNLNPVAPDQNIIKRLIRQLQ